jgi:pectate lyase
MTRTFGILTALFCAAPVLAQTPAMPTRTATAGVIRVTSPLQVVTPPPPTPVPAEQPPAPQAFAAGAGVVTRQKVNVWSAVTSDDGVNGLAGTQPAGATGTIQSGPVTSSGTIFWNVTFASGVPGWVGQDSMSVTRAAPTPPATPSPVPARTAAPPPDPTPARKKALAAFPGAQGSGAQSVGGRGGVVIEVTNLNDSGAGSLRACVSAKGPRTCVFRVSGLIPNLSRLTVNNPFLTIAGQTAPGGGIVIGGANQKGESLFIATHDVVVRYITYDGSNPNTPTGPDTGTVGFELTSGNVYNVVLDHLSARWWGNKGLLMMSNDGGPVHDNVMQWSLFYEPNKAHPVGPMTDATTSPANADINLDFHHNMFANTSHRLPLFNTKSGRWQCNLTYNWDSFAGLWQGATMPDIINNKMVAGNMNVGDNGGHPHEFEFTTVQSTDDVSQSMSGPASIYIKGNIGPNLAEASGDQSKMTAVVPGEGQAETASVPASWFRNTPLTAPAFPITADPAANLDDVLLATVGNAQHLDCNGNWVSNRDSQDARVIRQYRSKGKGALFNGQFTAPAIPAGTPCVESLHDGIPDQWKKLKNLSTTDANLYKKAAPNGYTWLENYLNGQ